MSERIPVESAASRLRDFEDNKAAHEAEQERLAQENYANEFYGDAGKTDFSDEAKTRLKELDDYEYERGFANRLSEMPDTPKARELYYDRMLHEANKQEHGPHQPVEGTLEYAEEEAYAEKENREAEEAAHAEGERRALDAKIESNPQLRLMNNMAREIAELRAQTDPEDPDALIDRVQKREDALNELLAKYENNELFVTNKDNPKIKVPVEYDPAIADEILNRTRDEELELKNSEEARRRAADEKLASVDDTDLEEKKKDDPDLGPVDDEDLEGKDTTPETDPDLSRVDDKDLESKKDDPDLSRVDDKDLSEPAPASTTVLPAIEADEGGWTSRLREKIAPGEKKKMIRIALGAAALAIVGVGMAWLQQRGMLFGGGGVSAGARDVIDGATTASNPGDAVGSGLGSGDLPSDGGIDMPNGNPPVDTLPASGDFSYPWDWANEAVGKENATTWLHELSEKAADAGYNVEWHGTGTQEWVEINGNSNPKDVLDILRRFA